MSERYRIIRHKIGTYELQKAIHSIESGIKWITITYGNLEACKKDLDFIEESAPEFTVVKEIEK
jgi:hypothetical protein